MDTFQAYGSSIADIGRLLDRVPGDASVTNFTLNFLAADTVLSTAGGVRVHLIDADHLFTDAGGNVVPMSTCGVLRIEVTEALKKSDFLARNLSTVTTEGELLESGGMVRVRAFCNEQPLQLSPDRTLKVQITTGPDELLPDMSVFEAVYDADQRFTGWQDTGQEAYWANWPTPSGQKTGYELIVRRLDWAHCSRVVDEQTATFCVTPTPGFDSENTEVYLVFKSRHTLARLIYDPAEQRFCLPETPIGYPVEVLTVSKTGPRYWLGRKETETGAGSVVDVTPGELSESELIAFLKSL